MAHRIREGMRELFPEESGPLGGDGKTVEIDETFVGGLEKNKHRNKRKHAGTGGAGKEAVFWLVERKGRVRSHHVTEVSAKTLRPICNPCRCRNVYHDRRMRQPKRSEANLRATVLSITASENMFAGHPHKHCGRLFLILKRGIYGTFHHVSQQHLKRYLAEFDFRYNERSALGINDKMARQKRLRALLASD